MMDPRLSRDINRMSTDDLVLSYGILTRMHEQALRRGDSSMAGEFSARLRAVDRELGDRQLRFPEVDEVAALRAQNDLG